MSHAQNRHFRQQATKEARPDESAPSLPLGARAIEDRYRAARVRARRAVFYWWAGLALLLGGLGMPLAGLPDATGPMVLAGICLIVASLAVAPPPQERKIPIATNTEKPK